MPVLMENEASAELKWKRDTQRIMELNHIARLIAEDSASEEPSHPLENQTQTVTAKTDAKQQPG